MVLMALEAVQVNQETLEIPEVLAGMEDQAGKEHLENKVQPA